MKLILILTFFCVSLIAQAQNIQSESSAQKSTLYAQASKPVGAEAALLKAMNRNSARPPKPTLKNTAQAKNAANVNAKATTPNASPATPPTPKLKPNEYSIATDKSVKIFSTSLYQGLLLSENCLKTKTPNCQAYTASLKKPATKPSDNMKSPYHNNFGAIHCQLIGGTGLIVKTYEGHDSDFCEFKDGSLVSSWSAYYKTHPQTQNQQSPTKK